MIQHVIDLPMPPSVNSLYRVVKGRPILSRAYRAWRKNADALGLMQRVGRMKMIEGQFEATILLRDGRSIGLSDADNRVKPVLDWAKHAGLIVDDNKKYCRSVHCWWVVENEEVPEGCRLILRGVSQGRAA